MSDRNIEQCGPALQRVLKHLNSQTGWHFSVLMGGPDPLDPLGDNMITRSAFLLGKLPLLTFGY